LKKLVKNYYKNLKIKYDEKITLFIYCFILASSAQLNTSFEAAEGFTLNPNE
jgi:hypothetical protein